MIVRVPPARNGEEIAIRANGGEWIVAWYPASEIPEGTPHGAAGICLTSDGALVLIGNDGERWGLPGGRPEEQESWRQTLHREVLEEACTTVIQARLLGFTRGKCVSGPEAGLVLVRSMWRAEVELAAWKPQFEIAYRNVVPAKTWPVHLWIEHGFATIYWRAFTEAGLA